MLCVCVFFFMASIGQADEQTRKHKTLANAPALHLWQGSSATSSKKERTERGQRGNTRACMMNMLCVCMYFMYLYNYMLMYVISTLLKIITSERDSESIYVAP